MVVANYKTFTEQFAQAISFQPASPINTRIEQSHGFLEFYPILSYVELTLVESNSTGSSHDTLVHSAGPVDVHSNDSPHRAWAMRTNSVIKAFLWLERRSVRRILKVVIVDDSTFPCSDETIEQCLQSFDIRYLNWNKDDLCIEILHKAGLTNIKELWLSWSGRNSVLYSWSCKDTGLPTMGKVN
jgi:hypothetical protein